MAHFSCFPQIQWLGNIFAASWMFWLHIVLQGGTEMTEMRKLWLVLLLAPFSRDAEQMQLFRKRKTIRFLCKKHSSFTGFNITKLDAENIYLLALMKLALNSRSFMKSCNDKKHCSSCVLGPNALFLFCFPSSYILNSLKLLRNSRLEIKTIVAQIID